MACGTCGKPDNECGVKLDCGCSLEPHAECVPCRSPSRPGKTVALADAAAARGLCTNCVHPLSAHDPDGRCWLVLLANRKIVKIDPASAIPADAKRCKCSGVQAGTEALADAGLADDTELDELEDVSDDELDSEDDGEPVLN